MSQWPTTKPAVPTGVHVEGQEGNDDDSTQALARFWDLDSDLPPGRPRHLLEPTSIQGSLDEVVGVEEPIRAATYEMETYPVEIGRDVLQYLYTGETQYRESFADDRAQFEKFKARYDGLVDTPTGEELRARINSVYGEYVALGESLIDRRNEFAANPDGPISADLQEFSRLQAELDGWFDEEVQPWTGQQLAEAEEDATAAIRNVYVTIGVLLLVGLLIGVLAAYLINRGIVRSVRRLRDGARRIGEGDMEHRVELNTSDELGEVAVAFNDMLDKRREANAALRESEERFRSLSDATFEGIAITERGRVLETNRAFTEMFGYEPKEVVGMSALDFMSPESRELVQRNISSDFEEPYEAVGLRKDGTTFDVEIRGRMSSYQGRDVRVTALHDITGRKEAEKRLREAEARYRTVVEHIPAITYI